jgi:shikimate kinase
LSRPALVLIGAPGVGKSSVGAILAAELGVPLIEVDDLVEAELGLSAEEAYATAAGTTSYRHAEERLSLVALAEPGVVVLGGSAVESDAVRSALAGLKVVWLEASVVAITRRLGMNSLGLETLIAIRNRLDAMLQERAIWYRDVATMRLATDRLDAADVARTILIDEEHV